jgi:hypothetical protein
MGIVRTLKGSVSGLIASIVAAAASSVVDFSSATGVRVGAPSHASDAVPKSYVDGLIQGLVPKGTARALVSVGSPADLGFNFSAGSSSDYSGGVFTAPSNGAIPNVDGVTVSAGDIIGLRFTSAGKKYAGLYVVTAVGDGSNPSVLTRAGNFNSSADIAVGSYYFVEEGTSYANSIVYMTNDAAPTLDSTALEFSVTPVGASVTAGDGLALSGSTLSVNVGNGVEISSDAVKAKAKSGGAVVIDADGIDTQEASGSQRGTMSSSDFTKLARLADATARGQGSTTNDGTYALSLPTLAVNKLAMVEVELVSRSSTDAAECKVARILFAARRGASGNSVAVGDADVLSDLDPTGDIAGVAVAYTVGTDGADSITITGVLLHAISHDVTARIRLL